MSTSVFVIDHSACCVGGESGGKSKDGAGKYGWEAEDSSYERTKGSGCAPDTERGQ